MLSVIAFYPSLGPHQARPAGTRLYLGNMDAKRDWGQRQGLCGDAVLILQQATSEDFVIATGEQHSVRDFVDAAATDLGITICWQGSGVEEQGFDAEGRCIVAVDPRYFRPTEVETRRSDQGQGKARLGAAHNL